ncbi:autophagy protein 5 [Ceratobasidium sp. 394]|nr:autophagy protein 5 [Ceratobasidium sp. 394]KAG9093808.1 autophagy protein 5 [Ceratobasidium sp. UAMH 11750]
MQRDSLRPSLPHHAQSSISPQPSYGASTQLFRRLVWEGTVPIEIKIDGKELPAGSDRNLESYYIQAPRISYLPLLIPDIRKHLTDLVLDETAAGVIKEEDWWFEEAESGVPMKWHWPLGLLYDHHLGTRSLAAHRDTLLSGGGSGNGVGGISWTTGPKPRAQPLKLILHLASAPTEKLLLGSGVDACKAAFMGQLKEGDFVRWGNTKRVTALRKVDQDGIWDGMKDHNFDDFWKIAGKIFPTTTPGVASPPIGHHSSSSLHRPSSTEPSEQSAAHTVRSIPMRIYLPDGPVLQDQVPPTNSMGAPFTLGEHLKTVMPLLFGGDGRKNLAFALIQGVVPPPETELPWLGACMAGADGWVNVCIGISPDQERSSRAGA